MAEYIEREKAIQFLKTHMSRTNRNVKSAIWDLAKDCAADYLNYAPAADVVEVVRCKSCQHYNTSGCADGFGWCEERNCGEMDEHFCSYGERKTENGS